MASERSTRSPLTRSRLVTELLANRNTRKNFYFVPVIQLSIWGAVTKQSESSSGPMKFQRAPNDEAISPPQRSRHRAVAPSQTPRARRAHRVDSTASPSRSFVTHTDDRISRARVSSATVVSLGKIRVFVRTPSARNLGNAGALPHATTAMTR